jgi:AcrR family transcriptional regulator
VTRRRPQIDLGSVLTAVADVPAGGDAGATALVDAAEGLLRSFGLRRWSMDDVAEAAGVGRTTVYRTFPSRDDLVHAVLARELRATLDAVSTAARAQQRLDEKVVAGMLTALDLLRASVVDRLLRTDPATILPFLTTDAGPLLAIAREAIAAQIRLLDPEVDRAAAAELGEVAARLGLSFVLTRESVVPLDRPTEAAAAVRRLLGPLLARLSSPLPVTDA